MAQAVDVPTSQDPELQDLDQNFLEGILRHNAEALWENTDASSEAAYWFIKSGQSSPAGFPKLCEAFGADPAVIRREVLRELHRQNVARIQMRAARWLQTANWYTEHEKGNFPFDWFVVFVRISKADLLKAVNFAIANPIESDSLASGEHFDMAA